MDLHFRVLKEPRGMIRVLQFIMSIFAFATTSGFGTVAKLTINCNEFDHTVEFKFGYPFRMSHFPFTVVEECTKSIEMKTTSMTLPYNFASNAEFFVATGVLSFLYCIGILAVYIFANKLYTENQTTPVVDFLVTATLSIFWFAGSCAWSQGVSDVKYYTNPKQFSKKIPICSIQSCVSEASGNFATLNVSLILGFANFLLWCASLWFVYKETIFHTQRQPQPPSQYPPVSGQFPPQSPPPVQSPTFGSQY